MWTINNALILWIKNFEINSFACRLDFLPKICIFYHIMPFQSGFFWHNRKRVHLDSWLQYILFRSEINEICNFLHALGISRFDQSLQSRLQAWWTMEPEPFWIRKFKATTFACSVLLCLFGSSNCKEGQQFCDFYIAQEIQQPILKLQILTFHSLFWSVQRVF